MSKIEETEGKTRRLVAQFISRVLGLSERVKVEKMSVEQFKTTNPSPFIDDVGVYIFLKDYKVQYIGCSLRSLAYRIWENLKSGEKGSQWREVTEHQSAVLLIIPMPKDEYYWSSSLETFLIHHIKTPFNVRI